MKRAALLLIAVTFFLGASLAASVKTAQEPKSHPAAAEPQAAAPAAHEGAAAAPAPGEATPQHGAAAAEGEPQHGAAQPGHEGAQAGHEEGAAHEGESIWMTIARLFNFALLAGSLIYLLRSPFGAFLEDRRVQIRKQLTDAAAMRETAAGQLASIEQKLQALPGELSSLKQRGAAEIAAEEERIRQAAEVERQRMLENAKREIDRRVQLAERRLQQRAGELAVDVATERVKRIITDADQLRLVDRYLDQVRPATMES